jgi:hypothetical protein
MRLLGYIPADMSSFHLLRLLRVILQTSKPPIHRSATRPTIPLHLPTQQNLFFRRKPNRLLAPLRPRPVPSQQLTLHRHSLQLLVPQALLHRNPHRLMHSEGLVVSRLRPVPSLLKRVHLCQMKTRKRATMPKPDPALLVISCQQLAVRRI